MKTRLTTFELITNIESNEKLLHTEWRNASN